MWISCSEANALAPDTVWGHWVTPAHVLGLWDMRLRRRDREEAAREEVDQEEVAAKTVSATASTAATASDPFAQHRAAIVTRRIAQSEQLDLFGT